MHRLPSRSGGPMTDHPWGNPDRSEAEVLRQRVAELELRIRELEHLRAGWEQAAAAWRMRAEALGWPPDPPEGE